MPFFTAEKVNNGWWVPQDIPQPHLGTTLKIKVFVEGDHKSLAEVRNEYYDELLPALGIHAEEA